MVKIPSEKMSEAILCAIESAMDELPSGPTFDRMLEEDIKIYLATKIYNAVLTCQEEEANAH